MYSFLLALIYLAFISLGLPDSLLGSGWPVMHLELGVPISYMGIVSMVISGMMCGLVGMFRVYGAAHIYTASISNDYYFEGLMVAMIAQYQALPTVIISFLFAVLKIGAQGMETAAGVPNQIYLIIQTVVIFSMAAEKGIRASLAAKRERRRARAAARARVKEANENE